MLTKIIIVGAMHASKRPKKKRSATMPLKFVQVVMKTIHTDQRM